MAKVDGSYLIARTLKEEGADCLFYLMGGPNYEIVNNSEDFGIRTVDFRHEQAAAMAAHAYGRVKRVPGVTTSASGPGTLNLLTGIYNAFVDAAPMVTLGGAGPSAGRLSRWVPGGRFTQHLCTGVEIGDPTGVHQSVARAHFLGI